jgi:F-type H+-transporting ATPase subunit b
VDINIGTLLGQTIAMIVFVWFCMKYIWPVIMSAIEARQVAIAEGLAAAESGQSALVNAQAEADKLVVAARDQARGIMDQANTRATAIVEQGKAEGEAERKRQLEAARAEIDVEMNRAREELRGQVAAIAIAAAEKVLSREIDAGTHRELLARAANDL